jgi:uncharacterized membrane protein
MFLLSFLACACFAQVPESIQPGTSQRYPSANSFTLFDVEPSYDILFSGINDSGQLVGLSRRVAGEDRGLLVSGGQLKDYQYPGLTQTYFHGINNRGDVVGYAFAGGTYYPFVFRDGIFTLLPPAAGMQIWSAQGINQSGDIAGYGSAPGTFVTGFLLRNGAYTRIHVPGSVTTVPLGLNRDTVVGNYSDINGNTGGFVWKEGQFSFLNYPGAWSTTAAGINESGDIVGQYLIRNPVTLAVLEAGAFLYRNGQFTRIRVPRTNQNALSGINNRGDAAGSYRSKPEFPAGEPERSVGMIVHLGK